MDPCLVLVSGLPGTGKTRMANELARRLQIPVFAKDRFQSQLRSLELAGREGAAGYHLLFDMADQQLALGVSVILDAVFPMGGFRQKAQKIAEHHGARFRAILCTCSDDVVWRGRMEKRTQYVPNWSPVGWDEVLKIRAYFEPWADESALHLDAIDEFDGNLSYALDWISADGGTR